MLPSNDRGRPVREAASDVSVDTTIIPEQLRRRREAALRCQPLHDGIRDPLDRLPRQQKRAKVAWVTVDPNRPTILVRGYVADELRRAGLKPLWSASRRGFLLDASRLPDATAALEHAGYTVRERAA